MISETFKEQLVHAGLFFNHLSLQLFQPFYQPDAYLPAPWYYPTDVMQYVAFPLIYDITTPNTPVNVEQTDVMPEWW